MDKNVIDLAAVEGFTTEDQEGDITTEKPVYTFRKLNSTDVFLMCKIIGKIGISEFTACFEKDTVKNMISKFKDKKTDGEKTDGEKTVAMVGIAVVLELANVIIGNIPKCEAEIYEMLSNVSGLTVSQVKELDFVTFTEMVVDFVKKDEFKDFIKVVSKLLKLGI